MSERPRPAPRACKTASDVSVGDRVENRYVITDADVQKFAELSGDYNPVHFDDGYAADTIFGRRIAHGVLSLSKFSGIFGMDLPGLGTLWESQEVRFLGPVFIGVPYTAIAEVIEVSRNKVTLHTWVEGDNGSKVIEGRACVIAISSFQRKRVIAKGFLTGTKNT